MPCTHEFGILPEIDRKKDYGDSFEPEKYGCVAIDDDYLNDWWGELELLPSFLHCFDRPEQGLARYGVTLLPPASAGQLARIIEKDKRLQEGTDLVDLVLLLRQAEKEEKFVIHYGV